MRIEHLRAEHDVSIRWRAFPLHPETPDQGISLEQLFGTGSAEITAMVARLKQVAAELDLPFGDRHMTFNSRLAQELGKWAESLGRGEAFHWTTFKTYFAEGRNLARQEVLLDLARTVGLDPEKAREVITERRFRPHVDHDWEMSRETGITAVPTFLYGKNRLVGAQPYEALVPLVTTPSRIL